MGPWHSGAVVSVFAVFAAAAPGDDIPGVVLVGVAMGIALMIAAIRLMFDKKGGGGSKGSGKGGGGKGKSGRTKGS